MCIMIRYAPIVWAINNNKDGKRMKPTVKIASLLMAVLMLFSVFAAGCTTSQEWSYKTDDEKLAIGVYLTAMYYAYKDAEAIASKMDDYDASSDSWLDKEITDKAGNKEVASKWIKDRAQLRTLEILVLNKEVKNYGATVDSAVTEKIDTDAELIWHYGTTNTQYLQYYSFTPMKEILEKKGVSLESFKLYAQNFKLRDEGALGMTTEDSDLFDTNFSNNSARLFEKLYFEGGSQAVSKEDLTKYFEDNYVRITILPVQLYESTTDEATQQSKNVAFDDAKVKQLCGDLDKIAKAVNDTKDSTKAAETSEKQIKDYTTANSLQEGAASTSTMNKNNANLKEELDKAVKELGEGKATTVKSGEGENAIYFYIFRYNTESAKDDYLNSGENDKTIIRAMKETDFEKYLETLTKDFKYEKSDSVDKYDPDMYFVAKDPETTAVEE